MDPQTEVRGWGPRSLEQLGVVMEPYGTFQGRLKSSTKDLSDPDWCRVQGSMHPFIAYPQICGLSQILKYRVPYAQLEFGII